MMGMGEPLLNLPNVLKATRILLDPEGFGLSPAPHHGFDRRHHSENRGARREPIRPKLAISLNASTEEQRQQLMPITRKYHLKDLMEACKAYPLRPWEKLTFEYVLLRGVNDTDADARRVVRLLANLNCKVNLIALNPGPGIPYETPDAGAGRCVPGDRPPRAALLRAQAPRPGYLRRLRPAQTYNRTGNSESARARRNMTAPAAPRSSIPGGLPPHDSAHTCLRHLERPVVHRRRAGLAAEGHHARLQNREAFA